MKKDDKLTELRTKLKQLAPEVTQAMRMEWAVKNMKGLSTVDRYFKGNVGDWIIGNKLYNDFKHLLKPVAA